MVEDLHTPLRLTRIRVYPLKGAAGLDLLETELDEFGIPNDRRWMLSSPDGGFLSQRTHPRLCLLRLSASDCRGGGEDRYTVSAPGRGSYSLRHERMDREQEFRVHEDTFSALTGDQEADRWFSRVLGEACRLAYFPGDGKRPVDPDFASGHRIAFADGYPLHLTTEESLQDLNRRLPKRSNMLRYRPNLVVAGGLPWEEDEWRVLRVGEVAVRLVKPCARCAVTTVDQVTGVRGREPLLALRGFREWKGKVYFGQNAVFDGPGWLRVGQNVHIVERGPRRPTLGA